MFTLSRTRVLKRLAIFTASLLLLATGVFFALKQNKAEETNAATPDGSNVTVTYSGDLDHQEEWPGWDGIFHSPKFSINSTSTGFCIDAWLGVVDKGSSIKAYKTNNDAMKLAIYIYTVSNSTTDAALSQLGISRNDAGFARIHAIVSYINDPTETKTGKYNEDNHPGWNNMMSWVEERVGIIQGYISSNANVWKMAKGYQLYTLDKTVTTNAALQSVAWIEPMYGTIKVQKHDNDTNNTTPQGNANLQGIHFQVINSDDNSVVAEGNTGADGSVTFQNIPAGANYKVKETTTGSTNTSYTITNSETASIVLDTSGHTFDVKNQVKRGKVTLNKVDKETGTCDNKTSELSFNGTRFQIINNSTNPVYINGSSYAKNSVIETKTFGTDTCSVTFENLPYGSYLIKETVAGTGYALNSTPVTVIIPTNNSYDVKTTVQNQPIRGDVKFVKMDEANNKLMANTLFSISALDKNNNVKETHIVVSNKDGVVDTSSSFALHSNHTNGYDALYDAIDPITFLGYGSWFGLDSEGNALPVSDSVGALPYGTYIIQELRCDANTFCTNIMNQKKTIKIETDKQVVDLGNWDNACAKFELQTTAEDGKDEDEFVEAEKEAEIVDTVEYCAKANMKFTIKGILMDKSTGEPLLVDGKTVENSVEITPEEECGTVEMSFKFDATELGGKDLVVFEKMYYKDEEVASHEDIDDEWQTIHIVKLTTYARNKETGDKKLPLDKDVVIEDLVKYCVVPGYKYEIRGILMDKKTGNGVLMNSKTVEQSVIIEPEEACGELTMEYPINTTGLGGAELVIFESLYMIDDESEESYEIISHKDLNNTSETVQVELPAPDTGYITTPKGGETESNNENIVFVVVTVVVALGGYGVMRAVSRKSFLNRK